MKDGCSTFRQMRRRDFLRIGGASLCGVGLLDVLKSQAISAVAPKAKQMIVCWMGRTATYGHVRYEARFSSRLSWNSSQLHRTYRGCRCVN